MRILNPLLAELDPTLPDEIAERHPLARHWRAYEHALDKRIQQANIMTSKDDSNGQVQAAKCHYSGFGTSPETGGPFGAANVARSINPTEFSHQLVPDLGTLWAETEVSAPVDRVLVLTNLDGGAAQVALGRQPWSEQRTVVVLGDRELGDSLDRHAGVRVAMPSVLGLRDLTPLISVNARARSSLDVERAQALARVFWPTRAYERAREVVARHRFVVLTGPAEMGKTAISEMLALAQMSDGWEAHQCGSPEQLWRVFDAKRRQVFVADDAFGSTEYRPDAAERWVHSLGRLLAMLDQDHWLIWTSRPAPLKAGLRRVQHERSSEAFPAPGEVLVDASDLDLAEKTLILFRHAKARGASSAARALVRSADLSIVEHPHFTPERIRRHAAGGLGCPNEAVTRGKVGPGKSGELASNRRTPTP